MINNISSNFSKMIKSKIKPKNPINNLVWYKKKANIIAMSSILGVGVLVTVIVVPVVLLAPSGAPNIDVPDPGPEMPPATNETLIDPSSYFSIEFNEKEIKKHPINTVTNSIIYNNMIFPSGSTITKEHLTINELVKNVEMNFVSFSLSSNFNQQFVTKTIYWDVPYSAADPNVLYNSFIDAWNKKSLPSQNPRWYFLYYPFASGSSLNSTYPSSYRQDVGATSLLYYLTGDLKFNNSIYDYAKKNMKPGEKENYSIQRWLAGSGTSNDDLIATNKNNEFLTLESFYNIVETQLPNNFKAKLPYKILYYFNQNFTLKEFIKNSKKYWEVTFPIGSVRVTVNEFANLNTNHQVDSSLKPNPVTSKNTRAITFRTSQNLLI